MNKYSIKYTDDTDFSYAVGRVRALEKKMIPYKVFYQLADSKIDEIKKILAESGYDFDKIEESIRNDVVAINEWVNKILNLNKNYEILKNIYLFYYDIENIKNFIKLKKSDIKKIGYKIKFNYYAGLTEEKLISIIDKNELVNNKYKEIVLNYTQKALSESSQAVIEYLIDKMYLEIVYKILKDLKIDFFLYWFENYINILNLKNLVRFKLIDESVETFKQFFFNYGEKIISLRDFIEIYNRKLEELPIAFESREFYYVVKEGIEDFIKNKRIFLFEKLCDDYILNIAEKGKMLSFGIEPIFCFLYGKTIEYKNILILCNSKKLNLKSDKIKEILRKTYV